MSHYFLDSSALVKLFIQEPGTNALINLLDSVENDRMLISAIAPVEVRSAVRRVEKSRGVDSLNAELAIAAMTESAALMVSQPLESSVVDIAGDLVDRHNLRALDALQLASCLTLRGSLQLADVVFICADKKLLQAAADEGLKIIEPA